MSNAEGSQVQVAYGEETSYGTTMTTLKLARPRTGLSLTMSKDTYQDESIRSDRQITDMRHGTQKVGGNIPMHLYYEDINDFLEGALCGDWSTASYSLTSTTLSFASPDKVVFPSAGSISGLTLHDIMQISGATIAANNGFGEVSAISGTTVTLKYKAITTAAAGKSTVVRERSKLINGVADHSYTIEVGFTDINQYHKYTGMVVGDFDISIPPSGIVNATFGFLGKGMSTSGTSIDATPTAASSNRAFSGIDASSVYEGAVAVALVSDIAVKLSNNVSPNYALGSAELIDTTKGRCNVTGTATVYFESSSMVDKFINETESSLQVLLLDPSGNPFWLCLPRIKYTTGAPDVSGEGAVMLKMDFQALYDSTTGATIILAK